MPKVGMEPLRRASLIEATISEIGTRGSLDVTVSQIAKRAGMSSALAHHYFGGKDQIFNAAMRQILRDLRTVRALGRPAGGALYEALFKRRPRCQDIRHFCGRPSGRAPTGCVAGNAARCRRRSSSADRARASRHGITPSSAPARYSRVRRSAPTRAAQCNSPARSRRPACRASPGPAGSRRVPRSSGCPWPGRPRGWP